MNGNPKTLSEAQGTQGWSPLTKINTFKSYRKFIKIQLQNLDERQAQNQKRKREELEIA